MAKKTALITNLEKLSLPKFITLSSIIFIIFLLIGFTLGNIITRFKIEAVKNRQIKEEERLKRQILQRLQEKNFKIRTQDND